MATTTTTTNKPLNPRAQDLSPKGYNRANIFSGKALDFDGVNDILTMPTALTSSLSTTAVTFATWVRSELSSISDPRDDTFSFGERGVILAIGGGSINYYFRHESSGWDNLTIPASSFTFGAWNFMVCTIDLGTDEFKGYVNGRLVASVTTTRTAITYEGNALTIGAQAGARFFDGQISGFKTFNTALTAAQVADLYLNPEKIVPDGVASSALKLWLPMMEGAGASAYDGSGNGNDGTINGATWTAGIGAPVAQTALVSWDKGSNLLTYSEDFTNGAWLNQNTTETANQIAAPNGTTTADKLSETSANGIHVIYQYAGSQSAGTYKGTLYFKKGTRQYFSIKMQLASGYYTQVFNADALTLGTSSSSIVTAASASIEDVGNGWVLASTTATIGGAGDVYMIIGLSNSETPTLDPTNFNPTYSGSTSEFGYIWGASIRPASAGDAYIKTNATAQTSDVLVPEGLTAGASIFGTDIITPRNAFALNLDGASWAQSHDNASVDLTSAATFEAWVNIPSAPSLVDSGIISKYDASGSFLLSYRAAGAELGFAMYIFGGGSLASSYAINFVPTYGAWVHVVGIYIGGTSITTFVNGAQASQNTTSIPATMTQSALNVQIGKWSVNVSDLRIANPRIYNRALTAAEVLRNYNADKAKFGL